MRAESMKLVKRVYPWETTEDMVCEYVRAVVRTNYYILTVEEKAISFFFGSITGESSGQIMLPSGLTRRTAH